MNVKRETGKAAKSIRFRNLIYRHLSLTENSGVSRYTTFDIDATNLTEAPPTDFKCSKIIRAISCQVSGASVILNPPYGFHLLADLLIFGNCLILLHHFFNFLHGFQISSLNIIQNAI